MDDKDIPKFEMPTLPDEPVEGMDLPNQRKDKKKQATAAVANDGVADEVAELEKRIQALRSALEYCANPPGANTEPSRALHRTRSAASTALNQDK